jgi:LysM repeat protein
VVNIIKEPIKEVVVPALSEVPIYYSHKISYGENLYRLAIRFNLTQKKLTELNGNKAKSLVAGSILKIPVKALHKVESGESLSVISDEYNVKIKTICQATEISKTAVLKVGMMLIIPNVK